MNMPLMMCFLRYVRHSIDMNKQMYEIISIGDNKMIENLHKMQKK